MGGGVRFVANALNYFHIPGNPIAYWISKKFVETFSKNRVSEYADVRSGMSTTDNERFLRFWFEVSQEKIEYNCEKLCWVLDDSGVYDVGHACYTKSKHKYTFRFKGIEWIDGELTKEVTRQYKEFLVYAKKYELEKDFEYVTR